MSGRSSHSHYAPLPCHGCEREDAACSCPGSHVAKGPLHPPSRAWGRSSWDPSPSFQPHCRTARQSIPAQPPGMLCPGAGARTPPEDFMQLFGWLHSCTFPHHGVISQQEPKVAWGEPCQGWRAGTVAGPQPLASGKGFAQCREAGTGCGVPTVTGVSGDRALGPVLAPFRAELENSSRVVYD